MKTFGKKSLLANIALVVAFIAFQVYVDGVEQWMTILSIGIGLFIIYTSVSNYVYFTITPEEFIMKMPFKKKEFKYAISDIAAVAPIREENNEGKKIKGALTIYKKDRTKETHNIPTGFWETRHLLMELRNYVEVV